MKQPIRYFSLGLLTASILLLIIFLTFESDDSTEKETLDEMIVSVEDEGYRVITESEYISLSTAYDEPKDDEPSDDDQTTKDKQTKEKDKPTKSKKKPKKSKKKKDDDKKSKKKDKKATYTLVIEENTMPSTISQQLEDHKIIKSATKFSNFLENNNYSPYVQIGKFKLTSDMSFEEIAKEITNR